MDLYLCPKCGKTHISPTSTCPYCGHTPKPKKQPK